MTRTTAILLCVLLLGGCARATQAGKPGQYLIECDGSAVPLSKCYAKAAKVCRGRYDVIDKERANGPTTGGYAGGVAAIGAMEHKNITVQCK